ncbi:hypothetical protein [Steroidobacter sp.]|uniref:hypothetical protein n=1 Tax=Steroidobacter sp. TaxID=1978227 RepID=UPI0025F08CA0|nr:hypothetical protein [Steroidobacter sp.]
MNRKVRRMLGLRVVEWYEDESEQAPAPRPTWADRGRAILATTAGRSILAAAVVGELTFLAIALPGPDGLLAKHRHHIQPVVEFFMPASKLYGEDDAMCRSPQQTAALTLPSVAR